MRQITDRIVGAFEARTPDRLNNTETDGTSLFLHGNKIAEWNRNGEAGLHITNAGWSSNTTKERLNGLRGVSISQKAFRWYLNGKEWNGDWVNVSEWDRNNPVELIKGQSN